MELFDAAFRISQRQFTFTYTFTSRPTFYALEILLCLIVVFNQSLVLSCRVQKRSEVWCVDIAAEASVQNSLLVPTHRDLTDIHLYGSVRRVCPAVQVAS